MWPNVKEDDDEYGRYRASMWYFGSSEENRGSALWALTNHPRAAVLRVLTKPLDVIASLGWIGSITPLGLVVAWLGLRGLRRRAREGQALAPGWVLLAYAGPAALLWVPASAPPYMIAVAAPIVLAMARGIDHAMSRFAVGQRRALAGTAAVTALASVALVGKADVMNSRALNQAAGFLEEKCRAGCVTNVLPQSIRVQAWVDLESAAPLPLRRPRAEERVFTQADEETQRAHRFDERVSRAWKSGFVGPVLWIETRIDSFQAFHPVFDRERAWEGTLSLPAAREERRFEDGRDRVIVYSLDPALLARAAR
jgi:hypothetical protein